MAGITLCARHLPATLSQRCSSIEVCGASVDLGDAPDARTPPPSVRWRGAAYHGRVQRWLAAPWQVQMISWVPSAELAPLASKHLPD
jgi:hypothetical protein